MSYCSVIECDNYSPCPQHGKLVVGYWSIRGLGAPLRMMCEYAGIDYEAKCYQAKAKEGGGWDVSAWFGVKPALVEKNALMNLPYIVDGDTVVAQTNACFTYLGRRLGLNGSNDAELTRVEQILCQVMDLRNDAVKLFYGGDIAGLEAHLATAVQTHYGKLNNFFGQTGLKYSAADEVRTSDFHLFEMLDQHETLAKDLGKPSPMTAFPKLQAFYAAFKALPAIAKYLDGPLHQLPCNNLMACWGAK